ncbi:MAG: peptidoglycan binding domain-containing protein [Actinomycetota bacterium]|nr:peptidoglycan binding domain-containing protein [Actinomycetota bacterium]
MDFVRIHRHIKLKSIATLIALTFFVSTAAFADCLIHWKKIHSGVEINGIPVGGLTPAQAFKKVHSRFKPFLKRSVIVCYSDKSWKIYPSQLNTKIDISKTVEEAFAVGREGSIFNRLRYRFSCWYEPAMIPLKFSMDGRSLSAVMEQIAREIERKPVNAGIRIKNAQVEVIPSQVGIQVKRAQALSLIRTRLFALDKRQVNLPITILAARIGDGDIIEALKDVRSMLKSPITLKYDKYSWEISPEKIGELIEFKEVEESKGRGKRVILRAHLHKGRVKEYIKEITKNFNIPPRDAKFRVNGPKVTIIPSQYGREVDADTAFDGINRAVRDDKPPREVSLTTRVVEPNLTTEEAKTMGIRERISTFTTSYNPNHKTRTHNIHLLAKSLDGTIVPPREVFSFNKTVGPRTAEKGYMEAPMILNGELVPAIGGWCMSGNDDPLQCGIFRRISLVERQNHSFYISRYPAGRDATVSYPKPDFKFRNDTPAHLLIKAWCAPSTITIAIYGTDFGTEVSYTTSPFTNLKPYPIEYKEDPALPKGEQVVEEKGVEGREIAVIRTVKRKGAVVRENRFISRYRPKAAVVRVGTMEVPQPSQETAAQETT